MFKDEQLIGVMILPNQSFLTANNFSRTILVQATKFAEVGTHAVNLIVRTQDETTVSRSITIEILEEEEEQKVPDETDTVVPEGKEEPQPE